ncbi:MAG: NHLP leader peptide family RiPP precursor [Schwartzia sp.]|nr:NHLP leader peptide family RiPP precursor [Schwartzia sp. (in: firmicutes)]
MDKKKNVVAFGEVVSKCWEDEAYKKRFLEDPEDVLAEAGFQLEEGVTYKVIEAPKMVEYLVLPSDKPKDAVQAISKGFLNRVEKSDSIIPEGAEVRIIQNPEDIRYLVLPASPKALSKAELAAVAGGDSAATATNVVQTGEAATTVVEILEGSTTGVVEFEGAVGAVVALVAVFI